MTTSGTTSDKEWYNEWQQMTTSGTTSDNEWQRVVQRMTTSDSEWYSKWQRMTTSNKKWQWVTANDMTASDKTNEYEWE